MERKGKQRETENPFFAPGARDCLARALSTVLSEHYGYKIVVQLTPKGEGDNETQTA